jgi:hypothetical protein
VPLNTQLYDRANRSRKIAWGWEDRMTICYFVLADGGSVGEVVGLDGPTGLLNMGYVGAGCDHTFKDTYGYSQLTHDGKKLATIWIRPGQHYREWRN